MRIGLLGGTFDPVHTGHLVLAEYAREQFCLDEVRFLPAGDPWRKAGRAISPASDRLEMVRLAIAGNDAFHLDSREVDRGGATYTVDTLRELRTELSAGDHVYFILGEDALGDMANWKEPEEIAALARLIVAPRAPQSGAPTGDKLLDLSMEPIDMPYIGISASQIRERVRDGRSIHYQVPAEVEAFIRERGLYRAG